jgi:hypothetical protein
MNKSFFMAEHVDQATAEALVKKPRYKLGNTYNTAPCH